MYAGVCDFVNHHLLDLRTFRISFYPSPGGKVASNLIRNVATSSLFLFTLVVLYSENFYCCGRWICLREEVILRYLFLFCSFCLTNLLFYVHRSYTAIFYVCIAFRNDSVERLEAQISAQHLFRSHIDERSKDFTVKFRLLQNVVQTM